MSLWRAWKAFHFRQRRRRRSGSKFFGEPAHAKRTDRRSAYILGVLGREVRINIGTGPPDRVLFQERPSDDFTVFDAFDVGAGNPPNLEHPDVFFLQGHPFSKDETPVRGAKILLEDHSFLKVIHSHTAHIFSPRLKIG